MPASPAKPLRLAITGMSCAGCVAAVETALSGVPGVAEASVNFAERTARVIGATPAATLIAAVRAAGYDATELRDASDETGGLLCFFAMMASKWTEKDSSDMKRPLAAVSTPAGRRLYPLA